MNHVECTPSNTSAADQECKALSVAFANAVDRRDYDQVLNLFTQDGEFKRWDKSFLGRDAISGMLQGRDENIQTRHLCTNIEISQITERSAQGLTYFLFYRGAGGKDDTLPLVGPTFVGEYHDNYVLTDAGWKIRQRAVRIVFGDLG